MTNSDYKEMYDSAPIGLWRTDTNNGRLLHANHEMAAILGYQDVDELAFHINQGFHSTGFRDTLTTVLTDGQAVEDLQIPLKCKDGSDVWVSLSARLCPDKGYVEGTVRKLSEQKVFALNIAPYVDKVRTLKQHIKARLESTSAKTA